ncbi:helix-turn-helix transcriptional regulator [Pseudogemmobacter faecipullorum]|uniref:WYL domain-containing protein n=1 Tax=Pseudogemmobacter faecipullorum TaxID=2755041 RepID=A0ABS8CTB3_9RHOB|nr:WYL domain-containing protein [Pseudogemmobacter faecipullorum]MCB5412055.1 WYL domain-containing protein [Pseudogemmobacter faecipullorum]
MRYARQEDLQKLALMMQGSAEGICLDDMTREFGVSRRTAERMRDAVRNAYPQIEEIPGDGGRKYWRFPPGALGRMVEPTLDELTAGHRAAAIARREGDDVTAETLERLLTKVQAMFRADRRRVIAADLEAQLMADGVAFRPGPRENIAPEILSTLREAILAGVMVLSDHRARGTGKLSRNTRLGPIAMLFGQGRQYLLAWSEYQDDLRLFALAGFEQVALEADSYTRPEGFDLQEWLAESFGIWREEPQDVEWCFLPDVAEEAAGYVFHPKQSMERLEDGSLIVRFRAGGRQEMEWYLARWGDRVEVLSPG